MASIRIEGRSCPWTAAVALGSHVLALPRGPSASRRARFILAAPLALFLRSFVTALQGPNSFFMDVRCPGCGTITTVFSHCTTVVVCGSCAVMLCSPTGGKAKLTEGCSFRPKAA